MNKPNVITNGGTSGESACLRACDAKDWEAAVTKIGEARAMVDMIFTLSNTGDVEGLDGVTLGTVSGIVFELLGQVREALLTPAAVSNTLATCAPDLLAELRYLRDCIDSGTAPAMSRVNAAIRKAEGGAS
jgi:hypothetical protein